MKVLVTGATGFIGSHAAASLLRAGHEVRALVRSAEKARRVFADLSVPLPELCEGDMTDTVAVDRALVGREAVVHAAATVSLDAVDGPALRRDNPTGTRAVVGGAWQSGARSIVYVSSLSAIFDPRGPDATPAAPVVAGRNAYARSKAESERIVRGFAERGAPIAILYPGGVIGPHDPGASESMRAVVGFLHAVLKTSGGVQMVDVRDLAEITRSLVERGATGGTVAAGRFLPWDDLAALLEKLSGRPIRRIAGPGALFRAVGSGFDLAKRFVKLNSPLSREALDYATLWREVACSPGLGVPLREVSDTFEDALRWLYDARRIRARLVPRIAAGAADAA